MRRKINMAASTAAPASVFFFSFAVVSVSNVITIILFVRISPDAMAWPLILILLFFINLIYAMSIALIASRYPLRRQFIIILNASLALVLLVIQNLRTISTIIFLPIEKIIIAQPVIGLILDNDLTLYVVYGFFIIFAMLNGLINDKR